MSDSNCFFLFLLLAALFVTECSSCQEQQRAANALEKIQRALERVSPAPAPPRLVYPAPTYRPAR
jgi:hypothetical protein